MTLEEVSDVEETADISLRNSSKYLNGSVSEASEELKRFSPSRILSFDLEGISLNYNISSGRFSKSFDGECLFEQFVDKLKDAYAELERVHSPEIAHTLIQDLLISELDLVWPVKLKVLTQFVNRYSALDYSGNVSSDFILELKKHFDAIDAAYGRRVVQSVLSMAGEADKYADLARQEKYAGFV